MTHSRPLIGVTTSARKGGFSWFCIKVGVRLAKGRAIRLNALKNDDIKKCDGYIIAGGVDIDPTIYGDVNKASVDVEPERDTLELKVIKHALKNKKPLLGICRGAQMINIAKGGNLYQNARDFYENFLPTDSLIGKIFARKKIHICDQSLVRNIFKNKKDVWVNSIHHQAIKDLGDGIKVTAYDENKIVQSIENSNESDSFILGVQWHPEFMLYSKSQRRFFKILVNLC